MHDRLACGRSNAGRDVHVRQECRIDVDVVYEGKRKPQRCDIDQIRSIRDILKGGGLTERVVSFGL